jgi:endonuclease/exonuclease/phosphatase family metal-dependent hydrolase
VRLITWNCRHGSLNERVVQLSTESPDLVFLQEWAPGRSDTTGFLARSVNSRKGIALGSLNPSYRLRRLNRPRGCGQAVIAARVENVSSSFTLLGIWARGPRFADDVLSTLEACGGLLRKRPAIVLGDLNSGTRQYGEPYVSRDHSRIVAKLSAHGLESAYHRSYNVDYGAERHPTYRHQMKHSLPWHIDFCFVPRQWRLQATRVIDSDWALTSDHNALVIDVDFGPCATESDQPSYSTADSDG